MRPAVRTATLTIVFTDIKGFTERTSRQTLEQNQKLLATHNAMLAPVFKALGGRVIKTIGDAFMVVFESPTNAVLSGAAIQDALWAYNQSAPPDEQLHVRVAINMGEVRLEGNDVFGEPVNIAARVEGEAEADEVTFTEAVYLSMNRAEVQAVELGPVELKGIPEKVKLFKLARAGAGAPFGNVALERARSTPTTSGTHKALELATSGTQKALELATETASKVLTTSTKLVGSIEKRGIPRARIAAIGGGAIVLVLLGALLMRGNAIERAISAAEDAKGEERSERVQAARALINQEKDQKVRSYYSGRLAEATDDGSAVGYYYSAAKAGSGDAEDRLVALLSHKRCGFRAAAASAVADLKLKRAKGKLADLAEEGGPDESDIPVFGCNSKEAAAAALKRLEK